MEKNNWGPQFFSNKHWQQGDWSLPTTLNHTIRKLHPLTLTMRMLWRHYSYRNAVFVTNNWLNLHKLTQDHTEKFTSHTQMLTLMNGLYYHQTKTTDLLISEMEVLKLNGKESTCHNFIKNQTAFHGQNNDDENRTIICGTLGCWSILQIDFTLAKKPYC